MAIQMQTPANSINPLWNIWDANHKLNYIGRKMSFRKYHFVGVQIMQRAPSGHRCQHRIVAALASGVMAAPPVMTSSSAAARTSDWWPLVASQAPLHGR
jgi:hypothetical protein